MGNVSRRAFLATAGIAGLGLAGAGLSGCAPSSSADSGSNGTASSADAGEKAWSWQTPPEEIPESDITETVETDVLIVGAGMSGLCTGLRARECGADVVILEKMEKVLGRGGSIFAMNSRFLKEKGYILDVGQAYKKMMGYHSYRVDEAKWMQHANRSGEAMDWLEEKMVNASNVGGNDLFPIMEQWYIDPEDING